jgi:diaminopimelate decarboxylase
MPMATSFANRVLPVLDSIAREFGTPFHIYDEAGIVEGGHRLNQLFSAVAGFREFYAVKALPNLRILDILRRELGFGFDCSSIAELKMARLLGARGEDIMFTSNNTSAAEYAEALADGGCILNLDDASFVDKAPFIPELICFRYNPGTAGVGNSVIGTPRAAKFGLRRDQMTAAYERARERGATRFGLHTMIVSNERRYRRMIATVEMLLRVCSEISATTGIQFEFVNIGGGISIPYRPTDEPFDLVAFAKRTAELFSRFERDHGYVPKMFMECGRLITGPHGVLVTRVINVMSKHREYVGVDASMSSLMRPAMYKTAYNHITAVGRDGAEKRGVTRLVDVVGSLCENNDKFAQQISLPPVTEDDYLVIHDTGAHGHAMGFQYNGRLRPQELLLRRDGSVEMIRRAETVDDYLHTQRQLDPHVLKITCAETLDALHDRTGAHGVEDPTAASSTGAHSR